MIKETTMRSMAISTHNAELCLSGYCFHEEFEYTLNVFEFNNWQTIPTRDLSRSWN